MNDKILPSLKLVFKPLVMYSGEWEFAEGLRDIALIKKDKNLYDEFIERYYYLPLGVIFKEDDLTRSFKYEICSTLGIGGRTLRFSKKAFLRNIISNVDDVVDSGDEDVFKNLKKAIRARKDIYRDVYRLDKESAYYEDLYEEYQNSNVDMEFRDYVILCKKKFTRLLNGYTAVLELFDKSLDLDKFISCFDINQLYLFTIYSILKNSEIYFKKHGRLDYAADAIDTYRELVSDLRKENHDYDAVIKVNNKIYVIDDILKEYDELLSKVK